MGNILDDWPPLGGASFYAGQLGNRGSQDYSGLQDLFRSSPAYMQQAQSMPFPGAQSHSQPPQNNFMASARPQQFGNEQIPPWFNTLAQRQFQQPQDQPGFGQDLSQSLAAYMQSPETRPFFGSNHAAPQTQFQPQSPQAALQEILNKFPQQFRQPHQQQQFQPQQPQSQPQMQPPQVDQNHAPLRGFSNQNSGAPQSPRPNGFRGFWGG